MGGGGKGVGGGGEEKGASVTEVREGWPLEELPPP